ncbi:MAG: DNA alkylation repair protein [Alistipes sp.]|nr:DNA alkylation repair protein [Alistipes sp.]
MTTPSQTPTLRMIQLLRRIKKEMNGAVTEAMEQRGIHYPCNYGVSIPTLQAIARPYGPDHALAQLLYRQQVRELQLAALFIEDPKQITRDQMREWAKEFTQAELVEQTIYHLFRHTPEALEMAQEWIASPTEMLRYAGTLTVASTLKLHPATPPQAEQLFVAIDRMFRTTPAAGWWGRCGVNALIEIAKCNPSLRVHLMAQCSAYASFCEALGEELRWQLEFLTEKTLHP